MRTAGLLALAIFFPAFAHAAVAITEIMYDLSGTDTGREWVEITNTGSSSVDASGYKFFEANTNHSLSLVSERGVLQPGGSAVIADDPVKFKLDWPSYSGILFGSSFSLSNSGESLTLKDAELVTLDSVTYDPSLGAQGDGNTLARNGSVFASGTPTPGAHAAAASAPGASSVAESSTPETSPSSGGAPAYVPPPSSITVDVGPNSTAYLEVPVAFTALVKAKSGSPDPAARVYWSFGDGSSAEGTRVEKTYRYAGTYLVVAIAKEGSLVARDDLVVVAKPAILRIAAVTGDGVVLANDTNERLDLSGWRLATDSGFFRIPEGTTILPNSSVLFPYSVMNLSVAFTAEIAYPGGVIAARYQPAPPPVSAAIQQPAATPSSNPQPSVSAESYSKVQAKTSPIINTNANIQTHAKAALAPTAAVEPAAVGAAPAIRLLDNALMDSAATSSPPSIFRSPWMLGLLGVIVIAGAAFIFL